MLRVSRRPGEWRFALAGGQVRFMIDAETALRSDLAISSKLLALAAQAGL
jgi:hypothetical protein